MVFLRKTAKYRDDDSGAVTVDWVVLTAALMLIGVAAVAIYKPAVINGTDAVNDVVLDAGAALAPDAST